MSALIVKEPLADNAVYGVRQVQYTVNGHSGKDFADAVAIAAFKQAAAIETTTSSYTNVVRARQKKIDELGDVLSNIARAMGEVHKKTKSSDKITIPNSGTVKTVAARYGIDMTWTDGNKMTLGNLQKAQTNVQYAIDREDNDIQQDIVTLQSYISKRDNAYSNAAKIIKKTNQAATSTIGNIGE